MTSPPVTAPNPLRTVGLPRNGVAGVASASTFTCNSRGQRDTRSEKGIEMATEKWRISRGSFSQPKRSISRHGRGGEVEES